MHPIPFKHLGFIFLVLIICNLVTPPSGSDEMVFLARRLGMGSTDWQKSAGAFEQATLERMAKIHERFLKQFSINKRLDK
jgi:hypothetical protein